MTEEKQTDPIKDIVSQVLHTRNQFREALCEFAAANGLSPTEITACEQIDGDKMRFWLERIDERDPEKVAFLRQENQRLRECLKKWQNGDFIKRKHILSCEEQVGQDVYDRLKRQLEETFGEGNFILLEGGLSYKGMTHDSSESEVA